MRTQDTTVHALHDLGASVWFIRFPHGTDGPNGAAGDVSDPVERTRVSTAGWARWAAVNAVAIGVHLVSGPALLLANRDRVAVTAASSRDRPEDWSERHSTQHHRLQGHHRLEISQVRPVAS